MGYSRRREALDEVTQGTLEALSATFDNLTDAIDTTRARTLLDRVDAAADGDDLAAAIADIAEDLDDPALLEALMAFDARVRFGAAAEIAAGAVVESLAKQAARAAPVLGEVLLAVDGVSLAAGLAVNTVDLYGQVSTSPPYVRIGAPWPNPLTQGDILAAPVPDLCGWPGVARTGTTHVTYPDAAALAHALSARDAAAIDALADTDPAVTENQVTYPWPQVVQVGRCGRAGALRLSGPGTGAS